MPESEYRHTLEQLFRLRRFGMRPGLEVIRALLQELDDPQETFRSVHVTGSKGKGSVSAMTTRVLRERGKRTGRFTSPHLVSYRERMEVDGRPIGRGRVVSGVRRLTEIGERLQRAGKIDRAPTFFETTTALAFDWFRERGVEQAVIEVGIGGRLDSTNVLRSSVGVVTTIEYEHTDILGPTLAAVAHEKAGIFHPGMVGVIGVLPPEAREEVLRRAAAEGVPLWALGQEISVENRTLHAGGQRVRLRTPAGVLEADLPLMGTFQASNAALAVATAQRFAQQEGWPLRPEAIARALATTHWRGRLERVARAPDLYLDAAHTVESAAALAESLAEISPFADPGENALLFGCLSDKPAESILERLSPLARTLVVVTLGSDRALPARELLRAGEARFPVRVLAPSVPEGLRLAREATGSDGFTLVTGSDYLIGEVLRLLEGTGEDEPDLSDPVRGVARPGPLSSGSG